MCLGMESGVRRRHGRSKGNAEVHAISRRTDEDEIDTKIAASRQSTPTQPTVGASGAQRGRVSPQVSFLSLLAV